MVYNPKSRLMMQINHFISQTNLRTISWETVHPIRRIKVQIHRTWKILKKKYEFLLIIVILMLSFALLSVVSIINSTYRMQVFTEVMDKSPVDCRVILSSGLDPEDRFDDYMKNYQGSLSIEEKYKSHVLSIRNAIILLNYQDSRENISKQWDFPNSNYDLYLIGIDEPTFNFLQNGMDSPISKLNVSYQQIQTGFIVANILSNYEKIMPSLNLEISTSANTFLDRNLPVNIDLFNDIANNSIEFLPYRMKKANESLSIINSFQIFDETNFNSLVGIEAWQVSAPIFLCGEKLMNNFVNISGEEIDQIKKHISLNIRFNRTSILKSNPEEFLNEVQNFRNLAFFGGGNSPAQFLIDSPIESASLLIYENSWSLKLNELVRTSQRFQLYSLIFFIPAFILCGRFLKTSFMYLIEKRQNEIGLYLINGMGYKTIKRIFLTMGFFMGAIGGLLGTVCGLFLTIFVGNSLFPNSTLFTPYIISDFWTILLQNGIGYMIFGGLFAIFSMLKPLKTLNTKELQNNLLKSPLHLKTRPIIVIIRNLMIIIFIASLSFAYIYDLLFETVDFNVLSNEYRFLFWALRLTGPLMGLFPFVLPLILISFITEKLGKWIEAFRQKRIEEKEIQKIKSQEKILNLSKKSKDKPVSFIKKLTTWNLIHKLNKNQKLLSLYALAIIFFSISINLGDIYEYSEEIHASLYYANAEVMNLEIFDDKKIEDIKDLSTLLQQNASELNFDHINPICHTEVNEDQFSDDNIEWDIKIHSVDDSNMLDYCFSWTNYSLMEQDTTMRDEWFIGGTVEEIMEKMETPRAILIPNYLLEAGVEISDTLSFTYTSINGTKIKNEGVIVGAYKKFPASYMERNYDEDFDLEIFMSLDLLQNASIKLVEFLYYSNTVFSPLQKTQISKFISDNFLAEYSLRSLDLDRYQDKFDAKFFEFFELEGYLIIFFAIFGILIYFLIDKIHSNSAIAILRSKGLVEKDLVLSSAYETFILTGIGTIFSLFALIGTKGLILYLNLLRSGAGDNQFYLFYHINWLGYLLTIVIGAIAFYLVTFGSNYLQIRSTRVDQKLEEIMRVV
ncbi:FtsX-like permease family protein [Candidatus Lokiarchaeum ossiferum]|uniref:FtsX-like permease family protein n=1 Tax=Candidatus Lokiarchaeum ossiferum TaxID=2951803 RepID=UPI00352D7496